MIELLGMIVTKIILALCLVISGVIDIGEGLEVTSDDISVEQAVEYLDECESIHQYYVNHPEDCTTALGYPEWHQEWVTRYQQIQKLIRRLDDQSECRKDS